MFKIAEERVKPIAEALKENVDFINLLEERDQQYLAVRKILSSLNDLKKACFIVVGVASVSYMLASKGEEHWRALSDYVEKKKTLSPGDILEGFVEESKSLARFRTSRLKRISLLIGASSEFEAGFDEFIRDLNRFRSFMACVLKAGLENKTIVFSVKMFYYVLKAASFKVSIPSKIPVPVDRRVALVSLTSGLIKHPLGYSSAAVNELRTRHPKLVRNAWSRICELARVPPLRVDALLWIVGGFLEQAGFEYEQALKLIENWLRIRLSVKWRNLIKELAYQVIETRDIHFL